MTTSGTLAMVGTFFKLLLVLLFGGCISPIPWLSVSLSPMPKESSSVQVTLHPRDKPEVRAQQPRQLRDSHIVEVELPRDWPSGPLAVEVRVLDSLGCEVGRGHTQVEVPAAARLPEPARKRQHRFRRGGASLAWRPISAAISLATFPARCAVSIVATGDVPIVVEAGGPPVQCPRRTACELAVPPGTPVQVRASSDPAVTFWSGPCEKSQGDTCGFTVKEPTAINVAFARPICRRGACWYNPLPQGNNLLALWGSSRTDVWAAGAAGTILHFDGQLWEGVESGTTAFLLGLWGSSARDVWACGAAGTLLHYDGKQWAVVASGTQKDLHGLFGSSAHSIWAVGNGGTILHYDGKQWMAMDSGVREDLYAVFGPDARTAWAVGVSGTLLRFDGVRWQPMLSGTKIALHNIWGRSSSELWGFTQFATFRLPEHRGSRPSRGLYYPIRGGQTAQGWVVNQYGRVERLSALPPRSEGELSPGTLPVGGMQGIQSAWMSGPEDIWVTGELGALYHFDGSRWSAVRIRTHFLNASYSIRGRSASDVWITDYRPWHWDGKAWSQISSQWKQEQPKRWRTYLELLVFGDKPVHFNPNIWFDGQFAYHADKKGVWASGPDDVWRIDHSGGINHFDGEDWQAVLGTARRQQNAIWGSGPDAVWIVGPSGLLMHFDGKSWQDSISPAGSAGLNGIWGSSGEDVWAVGSAGQMIHHDGRSWRSVQSGTSADLLQVWGLGADDVWAVGDGGTLLHYNGTRWSDEFSGSMTNWHLSGIWGSSSHDLWIVGQRGILIRLQR